MKIAAIQLDIAWEDPTRNIARAGESIARAAADGADLVVLPEMFSTGFSMNADEVAEASDGPAYTFLAQAAREHAVYVAGSRAEHGEPRPRNVACLFDRAGDELIRYAKIHPFAFAGEAEHYAAGDALPLATVEGLSTALAVCYDLRFPELFRAWTFRGAQLFVIVANWPTPRIRQWSQLLIARAIENQAFVVGVNRRGEGGGLRYDGHAAIIDPMGNVLAEGDASDAIVSAEIEPAQVTQVRTDLPFLEDVRHDLFPGLRSSRRRGS